MTLPEPTLPESEAPSHMWYSPIERFEGDTGSKDYTWVVPPDGFHNGQITYLVKGTVTGECMCGRLFKIFTFKPPVTTTEELILVVTKGRVEIKIDQKIPVVLQNSGLVPVHRNFQYSIRNVGPKYKAVVACVRRN